MNEFVIKRTGDTKIRKTVIHYMQPHTPYLKDTAGKDADNKLRKIIRNNIFWRKLPLSVKTKIKETLGLRIWPSQKAELGKEEKIRELYEENLEIVLNYVNELINYLEGKIVITSDHGERLGENGEFFHEAIETDNPVLREVPWLEIEKDESGDVDEGSQEELDTEDEKVDEEELKRKLEALGYKT